ncbi:MAG: hypothetical protein AAF462_11910 [Thermodesulfobacteriota bacterium]
MRFNLTSKLLFMVFALSLLTLGAGLNTASADDSLDGKTFEIKIKEHSGSDEVRDDVLTFKDGKFLSKDCEQYGFGAAPYEHRTQDGVTLFITSTTSEKEGLIQWEGKVEGDQISGTMIWEKAGQDAIFYKYKGSLKK